MSSASRWNRIQEIFDLAIERPPADRVGFVRKVCDGDEALRSKVEKLLAAAGPSAGLFGASPGAPPGDPSEAMSDLPIDALPGYTLAEEIHRGGQGVVYRAIQLGTRREVAVKFMLSPHFANSVSKRRFEREVEIVCGLKHPGIVPVFDSGLAHDQYYYVMDFIHGTRLDTYVSDHRLTVDETLRLFAEVCEIVGYAHQHGVIHRDLKPGNILVDERGHARVLDFGLAKLDAPETGLCVDASDLSLTGQFLGTLAYMGPEQVSGQTQRVDMRSDVYALGVILYELLGERPPYDLNNSLLENLNAIEKEAPRPLIREGRLVNHEVTTIVLKALSKDKSRRYTSGSALGDDIGRYLRGEAIEAKRDHTVYLLRKLVRKHWAAALFASVLLSVIFSALLIYRHQNERLRGLREQNQQHLYEVEMHLAGRAAGDPGGAHLVTELKHHWVPRQNEPDRRRWEWYYQNANLTATPEILTGHQSRIWALAFHPTRRLLVSGSNDGQILFWEENVDGQRTPIPVKPYHRGGITALEWSPDGKRVVSAGNDRIIKVWSTKGPRVETELIHPSAVTSLSWSPDSQRLITACAKNRVRIWDADGGEELGVLAELKHSIADIAWSPDPSRLAIACRNGVVEVWDADAQTRRLGFKAHANSIVTIGWNPDGTRLSTTSNDGTVRIWDARNGDSIAVLTDHQLGTTEARWSADGSRFATSSRDTSVIVYDVESDRYLPERVLRGHTNEVLTLRWCPTGTALASAGWDNTIRVWDVTEPQRSSLLRPMDSLVNDVRWNHDGTRIATVHANSEVVLWRSIEDTEPVIVASSVRSLRMVDWSPDGGFLAGGGVVGHGGGVEIWDTASGRLVRRLEGFQKRVVSLAWSPSGRHIATGGNDGTICVWDTRSWREIQTIRSPDSDKLLYRSVDWSPDGSLLGASLNNDLLIWETDTWKQRHYVSNAHDGLICSIQFSPEGNRLASASLDSLGKVWDVSDGLEHLRLSGHGMQLYQIRWHPDSTRLATSSRDGSVRIWDSTSGREVHRFRVTPIGRAKGLDWSPDGYRLVYSNALPDYAYLKVLDAEPGYRLIP